MFALILIIQTLLAVSNSSAGVLRECANAKELSALRAYMKTHLDKQTVSSLSKTELDLENKNFRKMLQALYPGKNKEIDQIATRVFKEGWDGVSSVPVPLLRETGKSYAVMMEDMVHGKRVEATTLARTMKRLGVQDTAVIEPDRFDNIVRYQFDAVENGTEVRYQAHMHTPDKKLKSDIPTARSANAPTARFRKETVIESTSSSVAEYRVEYLDLHGKWISEVKKPDIKHFAGRESDYAAAMRHYDEFSDATHIPASHINRPAEFEIH